MKQTLVWAKIKSLLVLLMVRIEPTLGPNPNLGPQHF